MFCRFATIVTLFTLLMLPKSAHAWSEADAKREVGYLLLHAVDWGQTLDISSDCHAGLNRYEYNPFLSTCPSRSEVNRYFLLTGIAHYSIARALPPKHRRWFQYVTIGVELGAVANNLSIGLRIRF